MIRTVMKGKKKSAAITVAEEDFIKKCKKPRKNEPKDTANVAEESSDEVYMLCDVNSAKSSLTKSFWGEALITAAYLINRSPSVLLLGYRLWLRNQTGFKVVISKDVTFNESKMPCLNNSSRKELDFQSTFNKVEGSKEDNQQREEDSKENQLESENVDIRNKTQNDISENMPSTYNYQLARDKDRREPRIPSRFKDFHLALNTECNEPFSYEEALESPDAKYWKNAMNDEINSLLKNKTWILVPKPEHISIVDCLSHWEALKWLLRDSRRSTTSYIFTLCGACISWKSQLQNIVALSTTEAEYIATTEAFKEAIWLKGTTFFGPRRIGNDEVHFRPLGFGLRWNMLNNGPNPLRPNPISLDGRWST
ncbi:Retrovirus-related Pol polyprotein from transposon TNT 1-94 [Sesamum angolense]|uniref:Retrovirus-related Pol polyprotein from transposon TNT 1-94 n=1 Tax=Sesamum angolense TaxID=2727404 RepID=A0AAE1WIB3_9LAMI|nr:Retrovirus-related Pol polyprotein from transposon TNT 1-94 [Sesamum angolense]